MPRLPALMRSQAFMGSLERRYHISRILESQKKQSKNTKEIKKC